MPYSSKRELPPAVKKLTPHQQAIWRAAFNNALKQYDDEEKAFAVAWAAVKKHKDTHSAMSFQTNQASYQEGSGTKKKYKYACCDPDSDEYDEEECRKKKTYGGTDSRSRLAVSDDADGTRHFLFNDGRIILDQSGLRLTNDGYLVANGKVARTGIQIYGGHEVGDEEGRAQVRVYRPEAEVFSRASINTFAHKPVTLHHPDRFVSSANWKDHAVGTVDGEVIRDGDTVRIPMLIMDSKAIRAIREGVRELSVGYDAQLDWTPGFTDSGEPYDAVQRGIRVNHIALTPRARGGPQLRIGDTSMDREVMTRSFLCDGINITLPDQDAQIVQRALRNAAQQVAQDSAAALASKELADKLTTDNQSLAGKIAVLEQQLREATVTDADLDRRVIERQALILQARKVMGDTYNPEGRTAGDIRRDAVRKRLGDAKATSLTDAAIEGAFEAITAEVKDSTGVIALSQNLSRPTSAAAGTKEGVQEAWEKRGEQMRNAWQGNNGSQVRQ